jgi:hypothetical protein
MSNPNRLLCERLTLKLRPRTCSRKLLKLVWLPTTNEKAGKLIFVSATEAMEKYHVEKVNDVDVLLVEGS